MGKQSACANFETCVHWLDCITYGEKWDRQDRPMIWVRKRAGTTRIGPLGTIKAFPRLISLRADSFLQSTWISLIPLWPSYTIMHQKKLHHTGNKYFWKKRLHNQQLLYHCHHLGKCFLCAAHALIILVEAEGLGIGGQPSMAYALAMSTGTASRQVPREFLTSFVLSRTPLRATSV